MGTTTRNMKAGAPGPTAAHLSTPQSPPSASPRHITDDIPAEPLVTIRPSRAWGAVNLRELWAYRELLYFLTWRDVKVRYKQTVLGVAWVVVQPLAQVLIFTLFFGRLAGLESRTGGVPYPLFAFAGVISWTFFSNAVTNSSNSLVGSSHLITKVYFPRLIIPTAAVAAGLVDFLLSFAVLAALMVYYGVTASWTLLMLPALMTLTALLALGVGMTLSALNVKYRDIRQALPFALQVWMFASPVIYPTTLVPEAWRWVLVLNPLTGIIEGFRGVLFGTAQVGWGATAASAAITLALLAFSVVFFRRMERGFADVI